MLAERSYVEKIVEQELSSILFQSLKRAEKEGKPYLKEALQTILLVMEDRRVAREKSGRAEP